MENRTSPYAVAEQSVRDVYDGPGWDEVDGTTNDALMWEDLRPVARNYLRACRRKILKHIDASGSSILDAASGPVQYPEYLEYSRGYEKRVCVDISTKALMGAKQKLGNHGLYVQGSIVHLPFAVGVFDACVCLHGIYHIEKGEQEAAVRELLQTVRGNGRVVIVYENPDSLFNRVRRSGWLKALKRSRKNKGVNNKSAADYDAWRMYYYVHPLQWWSRFADMAEVRVSTYRMLPVDAQRKLIPAGGIGRILFRLLWLFELLLSSILVGPAQYILIVMKKR